jgi:hypothetical protein
MRRHAAAFVLGSLLVAGLTLAAAAKAPRPQEPSRYDWHPFGGIWSLTGHQQTLPTEGGRAAAIARLSGSVVLSNGRDLTAGFGGDVIGFDDGTGATTGRAVWTDASGDRIFSTLRGEPLLTGRRVTGTITGGTGRWVGVTGEYQLTWQYVISGDADAMQGRSVDLAGRLRWREGT